MWQFVLLQQIVCQTVTLRRCNGVGKSVFTKNKEEGMLESIELLPNTGTFVQEVVKFSAIERKIYDLLYICDI